MTPLFIEKGDRFGRPAVNFYADERTGAHSRYPSRNPRTGRYL